MRKHLKSNRRAAPRLSAMVLMLILFSVRCFPRALTDERSYLQAWGLGHRGQNSYKVQSSRPDKPAVKAKYSTYWSWKWTLVLQKTGLWRDFESLFPGRFWKSSFVTVYTGTCLSLAMWKVYSICNFFLTFRSRHTWIYATGINACTNLACKALNCCLRW